MQRKNQISLTRKTLYGIMLLGLFFSTFGAGNLPAARALDTNSDALPAILQEMLAANGYLSDPDSQLRYGEITSTPPYAILSYAIVSHSKPPEMFTPNIALAYFDQGWTVRIAEVHKEGFNEWLNQIPENILSSDVKSSYAYQPVDEMSAQATYSNHYLPWKTNTSKSVSQRPHGSVSHSGLFYEAWDWQMAPGTELWASQPGKIAKRVDGNSTGTFYWDIVIKGYWCTRRSTSANYIVVNNDGGGASLYLHLQKGSIPPTLKVGDRVKQGDLVGKSGNVGFVCSGTNPNIRPNASTAGAHLHFQVQEQTTSTAVYTQSGFVSFRDQGWSASQSVHISKNMRCPEGGIVLYGGTNYSCKVNNDLSYFWQYNGTSKYNFIGSFDNKSSSLRVPSGWSIMVYESANQGGGKMCYNNSIADFGTKRFYKSTATIWNPAPYIKGNVSSVQVFSARNCGYIVFPWSVPPYIAGLNINPDTLQDDTFDGIVYSGDWNLNAMTEGPYNSTLHISSTIGDTASFQFEGEIFALVFAKDTEKGTIDVYVDDIYVDTVDQIGTDLVSQEIWSSPTLSSGVHTVKIVHASGATVDIDALAIGPNMPNNLTVSGVTEHSVTMDWQDASNDENGFTIYRWDYDYDSGLWDFMYYDDVPADTISYTDVGLNCGRDYYYEVSAYNIYGESSRTAWVKGTTNACVPVANDDFDSPTQITQNTYIDTFDVSGATWISDDPTIPACDLDAPDGSVWYAFTAPSNGQIYIDTMQSNYDTVLALWTGTRGNLSLVDCNDDFNSTYQSSMNTDLVAGQTYYIEAGRFYNYLVASVDLESAGKASTEPSRDLNSLSDFNSLSIDMLSVSMEFVSGPSNDNINSSIPISAPPFSDTKNTSGATRSANDLPFAACDRDAGMASVWYQFTAPATGQIYLDTLGSDYDTMLAMWSGSPGNLTLVGCGDDTEDSLQSRLNADVISGTTYYIEAAQFWDYLNIASLDAQSTAKPPAGGDVNALSGGSLTLNLDFVSSPSNDNPSGAKSIESLPYTDTMSTLGATLAADDPIVSTCDLAPGLDSVWYQYTPSENETLYFDTLDSNYDTYIAVWSGSLDSLAPVGCNDDQDYANGIYQSALEVNVSPNTTYFIEIAEWNGYSALVASTMALKEIPDIKPQAGGTLQFNVRPMTSAYIGGVLKGSYLLATGASTRQNFAGVDSGPVKVVNPSGAPIISAIRSAWAVNGVTTSFSQLMGLPLEQLSDTYVFPGYNNVSLNDQLRIANVDTISSTVTVTIGGIVRGTYPLAAGAAVRINYPGLDSGPVVVKGTSGVKIISSIREAWAVNGVTKSFVQLMGLPAGQLSNKYVFPAYNNVTLNEQLRIGNVDPTQSTSVTVTIGGNLKGTYPLGPGQAVRINYPGLDSGPVIVEGTAGVNIISSIRSAWAVNGVTTSFSQLMGMPAEQLADKYLFPGYNNVTLNDQLRIANVDTVPTTVTVTIGGTLRGTYPLAAGAAVRINYAGLDSGPVVVQGTSGVKIISSIREAWAVNGVTQSFVQLMGLPAGQLSTTYFFPGYNNITLNEQLRIGMP